MLQQAQLQNLFRSKSGNKILILEAAAHECFGT